VDRVAPAAERGLVAARSLLYSPPVLGNKEVIMPAYFIVDVNVQDPAGFEEYRKRVPATIEKYGGKFLVRGGKFEKLEGNWEPTRVVLLEFPSLEQAKRWYDSEEYREPKALRFKTARTNLLLVEGAS
jgi:uncharacterized protein (DUF1330 family)